MTTEDLQAKGWTLVHRFTMVSLPSDEPDGGLLYWRSPSGQVLSETEALALLEQEDEKEKR